MREISDAFLLNMAEISASLVGLFLVGVFVYIETGILRNSRLRDLEAPYIRSSAQIVIIVYAIAIGLSLTLVAMEPIWSRLLLVMLSVLLIVANVDTVRRVTRLSRAKASPVLIATEIIGTIFTIVAVTLPWILGGLEPTREDLTWTILLAFVSGFIGIWAMVLSAFDIGMRAAEVAAPKPKSRPAPPKPIASEQPKRRADDPPPSAG
jgi:hypothetical protein